MTIKGVGQSGYLETVSNKLSLKIRGAFIEHELHNVISVPDLTLPEQRIDKQFISDNQDFEGIKHQ